MSKSKKIVFAAGGTGGHLFPAQALADQLLKQRPDLDLLFAGAKLGDNPYFDRSKFAYLDILSTTPFRGGILSRFKAFGILLGGIQKSLQMLREQKPDMVIGFGSFHAFPILCAAALKGIPIVLFESNAIPGKVIRLFSKRAKFTGIFFPQAKDYLKGNTVEVGIPQKNSQPLGLTQCDARHLFNLDADRLTILVFGGSQGAKGINNHLLDLIPLLCQNQLSFQLIHLTGSKDTTDAMTALCKKWGIPHYIKDFEPQMAVALCAADIAICRSGAMTVSELLHYEVPAILIPYPFAADQHQLKNALFFEKEVGGGQHFEEAALSPKQLMQAMLPLLSRKETIKKSIHDFKIKQKKADLSSLVLDIIGR